MMQKWYTFSTDTFLVLNKTPLAHYGYRYPTRDILLLCLSVTLVIIHQTYSVQEPWDKDYSLHRFVGMICYLVSTFVAYFIQQ